MKMMYGRHFEIIHCTHKVASRKSLYDAKIQKRIHYGNKRLTMGSTQRHRAGNVAACLPACLLCVIKRTVWRSYNNPDSQSVECVAKKNAKKWGSR